MTGSLAERNLLGALLMDNRNVRTIEGLVSGADFADGSMGDVFDRVCQLVVRSEPADAVVVSDGLSRWGIRGINHAEPMTWVGADVLPWAAAEYAQAVRADAVRRGLAEVANILHDQRGDLGSPVDVASKGMSMLSALIDGASTGLLRTKTLAEVLAGEDAYDWVIDGLLERRDRLVITGAEGAGKTTFVRQLAVLSAAGIHPLKFTRINPVRVLVVDAENTERQWRRAVRWTVQQAQKHGAVDPVDQVHIVAGKRIDITRGSHLGEIHRLIDHHKPDVVFIGPLYKLVPKAINSDDDAAPLIVALDSLRDRDVALVMEAHAGHAVGYSGERDLRPRGSSALLGWPEFGFGLRPVPDDPDMVSVVRWRGDRDQRDWPRHMRRGGEWPWVPSISPQDQ